jgi:hypothetical protein
MSFLGHKTNAPLITDPAKIPDEWFLTLDELNKKKEYVDETFRKETAKQLITEMVKKEKERRAK